MSVFLRNRMVYLTTSFLLMLACLPLISVGTTAGPDALWWIGIITLLVGAAILPLQRLLAPAQPEKSAEETPD